MGQILRAQEGRAIAFGGMRVTCLAGGGSTREAMSIYRAELAPRSPGAGLHRHRILTETFEVHEGHLALRIEGHRLDLGPGDFVLIPPGQPHAFSNRTDAPVRFTLSFSPALDREGFFEGLSRLAAEGRLGDDAEMEALMRRHDQEPLEGFAGWSTVE